MSLHPTLLTAGSEPSAIPVSPVTRDQALTGRGSAWAAANGFSGKAGQMLLVPGDDGALSEVLFGVGAAFDPAAVRPLAAAVNSASICGASQKEKVAPPERMNL